MTVKAFIRNSGTNSQHYVLADVKENRVLFSAPNNWKTKKGAESWARKHNFDLAE